MNIGQIIRLRVKPDGTRVYGKVVFVHPQKRYMTVERDVPFGGKIRETVYMGRRRGRRGE